MEGTRETRAEQWVGDDAIAPLLVSLLLKARPVEEGGRRFVYIEPSAEVWDAEDEKLLKSALWSSKDLFLTKGNIDIDHMTIVGYRVGVANPRSYEIGVPVEVRDAPGLSFFVKAEIYRGHEKADWWWNTQVGQTPPMRWYPSVGGYPKAKQDVWDPDVRRHRTVVTKAQWINLALAQQPQNLAVQQVSIMPMGAFMKSLRLAASGGDLVACEDGVCGCLVCKPAGEFSGKAITAGAQVSPVGLAGGGALRVQSHQGLHRNVGQMAARYLRGGCEHVPPAADVTKTSMRAHFQKCEGLSADEARIAAGQLIAQISERRKLAVAA